MTTLDLTTKVEDLLGSLDPDSEPQEQKRNLRVEKNERLERLVRMLDAAVFFGNHSVMPITDDEVYRYCLNITLESYSAQEIETLAIIANDMVPSDYHERFDYLKKCGLLFSALMHKSEDTRFVFTCIPEGITNLGYENDGNTIFVDGDVGHSLGKKMIAGKIDVTGHAGTDLGEFMRGGNIKVGSAGSNAAHKMFGGLIVIEEDVGTYAGKSLHGGTLCIFGNADNYIAHQMYKGFIFVGGSIVDPKGAYIGGAAELMRGGEIHIRGNVGPGLGDKMEGGTIYVHGLKEIDLNSTKYGGTIYQRGRLLLKEGVLQ